MKTHPIFTLVALMFVLFLPSHSFAADCLAERFPDRFHTEQQIRDLVQPVLPVYKRINKRKTLVLETVSVSRDGCDLALTFHGKLKRKIRKDPSATVVMKTTMGADDLCVLEDLRVSHVNISSTPGWVDNWVRDKANDIVKERFTGKCLSPGS